MLEKGESSAASLSTHKFIWRVVQGKLVTLFTFIYCSLLFIVYVWVHIHHGMHEKVRGQLFSSTVWDLGIKLRLLGLSGNKCPYPLSHLTGPCLLSPLYHVCVCIRICTRMPCPRQWKPEDSLQS